MFMKLTLVLVVLGVVAFVVGTLTVPELGESNPRVKILAAVSVAKTHRKALDDVCANGTLGPELTLQQLGLEAPEAYAGNFRSRVDVDVMSAGEASVTVRLRSIASSVPADAAVTYTGRCSNRTMTWTRQSTPASLLPEEQARPARAAS